jgi:hypothetical protein
MSVSKETKTREQLEALIRARVRLLPITKLEVVLDPVVGWSVNAVGDTRFMVEFQQRLESIASELREIYTLASDKSESK